MMSIRAILLAGLIAVVPLTDAAAQSRGRDRDQDREGGRSELLRGQLRDSPRPEARPQRADPGDAVRRVSAGRPGRFLGVSSRGGGYVVRWEYPGGRVADIMVDDGGRVMGER